MSVLRRAKLRTPDGTESIEYPLGVDAENVEVANGENLSQRLARIDEDLENNEEDIAAVGELAGTNKQNIGANEIRIDALERRSASVDKKPYYFDTIADMKAYQELKVGDMAITLGYYEANDGGGAEYKIVSGNYTDDGGSYHELENNLFAELIKNNNNNVNQFGAYGNGIHDDTEAIQKYFNFCKFGDIIRFVNGCSYYMTAKTYIKEECSIDFNWATIIVDSNLKDYVIYWGYNDSYQRVGWNRLRCYAHNFYVRTSDNNFHEGTHFMKVGRESVVEYFDSRYIDTVIAWDDDYIDFTVIKYGYISSRSTSNNFAIDIGSQGDLLEISHIQQGGSSTECGDDKTIRIKFAHYNALIKDIIGSIETYTDCIIENIMMSYDMVIKCYRT